MLPAGTTVGTNNGELSVLLGSVGKGVALACGALVAVAKAVSLGVSIGGILAVGRITTVVVGAMLGASACVGRVVTVGSAVIGWQAESNPLPKMASVNIVAGKGREEKAFIVLGIGDDL